MNNQTDANVLLALDQKRSILFEVYKAYSSQNSPYSCYGILPALCNTLGFNGERLEPLTGNYLLGNGFRAFNPILMRFNSPDNMSPFAAGGVSSYAYCLGDPVNRRDPSGNISECLSRYFKKSPTQRNLPASIKIETSDTYTTHTYTRTYNTDSYPMNIVDNPKSIPEGYQLIGLHGTKKEHVSSLESGLDINYSKSGLAGRGLYITQYAELANNSTGLNGSGSIVGVYVKNFSRWVEGKHYSRLHSQVMVIHERAYYAVRVSSDIKFPMVFDTAYAENPSDEPYGGRSWF
jgi:RHS repeat-associated protein